MMATLIIATLITIPLLGVVTFIQVLYLESLRLRTRDLPALKFFKDTLEDKIGLKTEQGAGIFSLIKHSLLVWLTMLFFAWFADGQAWTVRVLWQTGLVVWLTMVSVSFALPQLLYRRTTGRWLLPIVPLLRALALLARPADAVL